MRSLPLFGRIATGTLGAILATGCVTLNVRPTDEDAERELARYKSLKDPSTGVFFSALVPGGGQLYGEDIDGALITFIRQVVVGPGIIVGGFLIQSLSNSWAADTGTLKTLSVPMSVLGYSLMGVGAVTELGGHFLNIRDGYMAVEKYDYELVKRKAALNQDKQPPRAQ